MGRKAIGPFHKEWQPSYRRERNMKKILSLLVMTVVLVSASFTSFGATQTIQADLATGIVNVEYSTLSSSKILLLVEKDGQRYSYPIVDTDVNQFPLQLGNGTYTVRLMQNTTGNSYKELTKTSVTLNLANSNVVYLNSIQDIEWNEDTLAVQKAYELTKNLTSDDAKVKAIYNYITKNYKYDYSKAKTVTSGYFPNVDSTFASKNGICYDYSALFAAMTRSVGIPTKLVKGYSTNTGDVYHAWNEVYINGTWKTVDTTVDASYVQANKTVSMYKLAKEYSVSKVY